MTALKNFHVVISTGEKSFDALMNQEIATLTFLARNDITWMLF
jgi:hypothetical protein